MVTGRPRTWDELEMMAARIQAGERAKVRTVWRFVWQGAAAEALTCDALAWQTSEGSGRIIEAEATVRVNNPRALLGHFIHINAGCESAREPPLCHIRNPYTSSSVRVPI